MWCVFSSSADTNRNDKNGITTEVKTIEFAYETAERVIKDKNKPGKYTV